MFKDALNEKGFNVQLVHFKKEDRSKNGWTRLADVQGGEICTWQDYGANKNYHNRPNLNKALFDEVLTDSKIS